MIYEEIEDNGLDGYQQLSNGSPIMYKDYIFSNKFNISKLKVDIISYRVNYTNASGQINLYEVEVYQNSSVKQCLDTTITGDVQYVSNPSDIDPLNGLRNRITSHNQLLAQVLKDGSNQYINYEIIEHKEFLKALPVSVIQAPLVDYKKVLSEDIDICEYVDSMGVSQVWLWGYHSNYVAPLESNMSMGVEVRGFWNEGDKLKPKKNAKFGDISNDHTKSDNLPQCQNSYTVFNPVYGISYANAIHNHVHQFENLFAYLGGDEYCLGGNIQGVCINNNYKPNMFWDLFVGKWYGSEQGSWICGNSHFPPNNVINQDYLYDSTYQVDDFCSNWVPKSETGRLKNTSKVSCVDWGCDDIGFYVWWMKRVPSNIRVIPFGSNNLANWWDAVIDMDKYLSMNGESLVKNQNILDVDSNGIVDDKDKISIVRKIFNTYDRQIFYAGREAFFDINRDGVKGDLVDLIKYIQLEIF